MVNVSLFAASIRPNLYPAFFNSLKDCSVSVEVVFAGHVLPGYQFGGKINGAYTLTGKIKPAQAYEVARRECSGDVVVWCADDCEFKGDVLGKAYRYWKTQDNRKLILSIQTAESGLRNPKSHMMDMKMHTFFGGQPHTPIMAPLGMMSREYLDELGGYDRRYVTGQAENDVAMRAYADGGTVEIFGDREVYIDLDHIGKCGSRQQFLDRPFGQGYPIDRKVLEGSWVRDNHVTLKRNDAFEPFENAGLTEKSQSNNLPDYWI